MLWKIESNCVRQGIYGVAQSSSEACSDYSRLTDLSEASVIEILNCICKINNQIEMNKEK